MLGCNSKSRYNVKKLRQKLKGILQTNDAKNGVQFFHRVEAGELHPPGGAEGIGLGEVHLGVLKEV